MRLFPVSFVLALFPALFCIAQVEETAEAVEAAGSPEALAERARGSVVLIRSANRAGKMEGTGTGFVVSTNGTIASNHHVIGDHRAFHVEFADGTVREPTRILALDRKKDLVLIQIDPEGLDLKPLTLGDPDAAKPGQEILTLGNPLGLEFSVAKGVLAARRDFDGLEMLQVAVPLEPGSSGSPVLDMKGEVLGVLGIKSGDAIGLAVPTKHLQPLLADPRPIAIPAWLTIGALDPAEWRTRLGAGWRQRAGRIQVTGMGTGFGGRTLGLSQAPMPGAAYDLSVEVKLDDESGAAGLVFASDGKDRCYGFYPTSGQLRLTRFDGPDVFSWTIIDTVGSEAYVPGEWNHLQVHHAPGLIQCRVNGVLVIESRDNRLQPDEPRVGLCKFRAPNATFRHFRLAKELPDPTPDPKKLDAAAEVLDKLAEGDTTTRDAVPDLAKLGSDGTDAVTARARELAAQAAKLERLASRLHRHRVIENLKGVVAKKPIDLPHATLLLAQLDNADLDVEPYRGRIDRIASVVTNRLPEKATDQQRFDAVREVLFEEMSFHGGRTDYYSRSNAYLNEVLDDREGQPLTLSLLFVEVANRVGLEARGVSLPRHFVAKVRIDREWQLVDCFNGGRLITAADAEELTGLPLAEKDFVAARPLAILVRMINNLLGTAREEKDTPAMIGYLDVLIAIDPAEVNRLGMRAMLLASESRHDEALEDLEALLAANPPGLDLRMIERLRERVEAEQSR